MRVFSIVLVCLQLSILTFSQSPGDIDLSFGIDGKVVTYFDAPANYQSSRSYSIKTYGSRIYMGGVSYKDGTGYLTCAAYTLDGELDSSFSDDGKLQNLLAEGQGSAMDIQNDGKILVAGSGNDQFIVTRINPDGTLDADWNHTGVATWDVTNQYDRPTHIAIQSDGKVLVGGWSSTNVNDISLVRFNTDGSHDASFASDGVFILDQDGVAQRLGGITLLDNGKILISGGSTVGEGEGLVCKLTSDGIIDSTFAMNGFYFSTQMMRYFTSLCLQPDGKVLITGSKMETTSMDVLRLNPDGSPDLTFGINGYTNTGVHGFGNDIKYHPNNKIVVFGYSFSDRRKFAALVMNSDGSKDMEFGDDGISQIDMENESEDYGRQGEIQHDGKLLITGQVSGSIPEYFAACRIIGPTLAIDQDSDGYDIYSDCNDTDPFINPGQLEIPNNGINDDCDEATTDDLVVIDQARCLEQFHKVAPEPMESPLPHGYAESVSIHGNVAAVGIKLSDSLELDAGLVHVYELADSEWKQVAALYPSTPIPNMNFGTDVHVTENYIFISSRYTWKSEKGGSYILDDQIPGAVYIYKRPDLGWASATETASLHLGANSNEVNMEKLRINHQEDIIALHDDAYLHFFIRKGVEWGEEDTLISFRHDNSAEWIRNVAIHDNLLAITVYDTGSGSDKVYLKSVVNDWTQLEDRMVISRPSSNYFNYGRETILSSDHLLIGNWAMTDSIFLYSSSDDWATLNEKVVLTSQDPLINSWDLINPDELFMNDTLIAIGRKSMSGSNVVSIYKKPASGWSDNMENTMFELPAITTYASGASIAFSPAHMLFAAQLASPTDVLGNSLLFYNIEGNTPLLSSEKSYNEINGTAMNFGQNAVIYENVMAVMTYDNDREIEQKEEVHLHLKNPDGSWQKVNILSPQLTVDQSIGFGSSIAFYNDYLVIGAPGFIEDGFTFPTGRVYVYKKNGDWSNVQMIAELQPSDWQEAVHTDSGIDLSFGYSVAIDKNTIVVAAPGKNLGATEPEDHGVMYVYEKPSWLEWTSGYETAKLLSNHASEYARIGSTLVLQENCIITPHYWATKYGHALISVFKKPASSWKDTVETYVHQIEYTGSRTFNQGQIVVDGEFLFVGDPIYRNAQDGHLGRIFIFRKSGKNWSKIEKINTLTYRQGLFPNNPISPFPVRKIGLGLTFSVVDNILIAGLDYMGGRLSPHDNLKGKVMVYQALDPGWEKVNILTELESDNNFTQDGFGYRVMSNKDDIIICAPSDDSKAGINSGAVYNFSMSPTLRFQEPVCVDNGKVNLAAYPEGGIWSGPGIVDGSENLFYPDIAGAGIHELTYTTQNCSYDGKINITVKARDKPIFKHPLDMEICENGKVTLEVDAVGEAFYRWYFKPETASERELITENSALIQAIAPGNYWVESHNVLCPDVSDTVVVKFTPNPISIVQPLAICDPQEKEEIEFMPLGGNWLSFAVDEDNRIIPSKLRLGQNELVYEFEASPSCTFLDTIMVEYDPLSDDGTVYNSQEICPDDIASIELNMLPDSKYFLHKVNGNFSEELLEIASSPCYIENEGEFYIEVKKHSCSNSSNIFQITYLGDSLFIPNVVTDNGDHMNDKFQIYVENVQSISVSIFNRYGKLLFDEDDYNSTWPDKKLPTGTYFYECYFNTTCNSNMSMAKGWIQLLR